MSRNIGMEFGSEKCTLIMINSRERETIARQKLPNQVSIRKTRKKENSKHLGI